jgi:hypothetical protein
MKMKIYFIVLALIAQNATAMESDEAPDFPAPPRPYTIAQLVHDLRRTGKLEEIIFIDPQEPDFMIINLDNRRLTDLTGLSLLLPDDSRTPVWKISACNNYLIAIPADDLAHYKDLEVLKLDNNCITSLGEKSSPIVFAKICPQCTWLTLSNNHISHIHAASFSGLRNIEYLSLRNNRIHTIEDRAFRALLKLEILYLDTNNLCNFPDHLVKGLHQLEKLTLHDNHLPQERNIALPSRTKLKFQPQKVYDAFNATTLSRLQAAILENKTPSKREQVLKIATLINTLYDAENPLFLKETVQICTHQEQDLIFENAPDCARAKFCIILAELKRQGKK